jgi:hypothetical protein
VAADFFERGGVLWAYLGPPERQPALPEWEFALVPNAQRFVSMRIQESQSWPLDRGQIFSEP